MKRHWFKKEVIFIIEILTAIGDPSLNNALRFENEFEVPEKDISYREGVLESLEKEKNIDIIILYEKIPGEIDFINLIKNIKLINNKIIIFFILEKENEELQNLLKTENIKNIFYINEININDFINKIKNVKTNNENKLNEEIIKLKNIINKKNEEILKYKNNKFVENNFNKSKNIIVIIGEKFSGKTLIINNLKNVIKNNELYNFNEININNYLEIEKNNHLNSKLIFIVETQPEVLIRNKKIINKLIYENKINSKNIYIIFNKINKYSPNINISKNLYKEFNIIGKIYFNNYCDFINNEKNKFNKENKKLKRTYNKIFNKLLIDK